MLPFSQSFRSFVTYSVLQCLCGCGVFILAGLASNPVDATEVDVSPQLAAAIGQRLKSANAQDVESAISDIEAIIDAHKGVSWVAMLQNVWGPQMLRTGHYAELDRFAFSALLAAPYAETGKLAVLREHALISEGKGDEALSFGKSLFNVCRLRDTGIAIGLLGDALKLARPTDPGAGFRLRQQQALAAMQDSEASQIGPYVVRDGVAILSSIDIDDGPYRDALAYWSSQDTLQAAMAKGNLYLLSGHPQRAKECFVRAEELSSDDQLQSAAEGVARSIRATDGNVARANAWVVSMRPKPTTSPSE